MKPLWLAVAVLLGAFLVWRRRRLEPTLLVGGAIAVVGSAVYGAGLVQFPNVEELLVDIGEALGPWTYGLVAVMAFLETGAFIGLLAPGETVMLVGGLIAGQGRVEVLPLIAIAWACAVAGDVTSFFFGRRLGRPFLERHGPKFSISEDRLRTVERFFDQHGGKAVLIGRFVGLVRAIAPFLAGSSGMPLRRFVPYDVIGAGIWATTFIVLGYVFWQSFDKLLSYAGTGALALGTTITIVVAMVWLWRWMKVAEHRRQVMTFIERQERRRALRPAFRVGRPVVHHLRRPALFVWHRLTPGELGLELTTLTAVAGVGAFAFITNLMTLRRDAYVVGDQRVLNTAGRLAQDTALDVAAVVTNLGALPVAIAVVVLTSAVLVWRGEARIAVGLAVGLALTYLCVHVTKGALDRPRPASAVTGSRGSAYPSGHVAYAVSWVACAVALQRALPTVGSRFAFVTVGIVIVIVVALTRLYLRVHWLSDVVGGVGAAAAIFSICGIAALVVGFLRENPEEPARGPRTSPAPDQA